MTCKHLAGACDMEFHAETFEEMAQKSQQHGAEMFQKGDEAHVKAMEAMKEKMSDSKSMQEWMEEKCKEFESLPEDK